MYVGCSSGEEKNGATLVYVRREEGKNLVVRKKKIDFFKNASS